ncbi:hypothetical protein BS47DRAFT_1368030 [Hydnum rufescens UP504]|uniref:Uncharacterized protein n=1 Tax=Hydnum rufescens UP504 TaxID=1448309 RepID=A0A9P6AHM8_9AGAM|nr:hypothetical protein BS47DRAFT_1368030 [Hydnum rufescens UP504]
MLSNCIGDRIGDATLKKLYKAKDTRELLEQYCSQAGQEITRYQPIRKLGKPFLNYRKPSGPTFCRNDLTLILGSVAERKPEVILVSANSAQLDHGTEHSRGPQVGFYWDDVCCSVEFKVKVKDAERGGEALTSASQSLSATSHGYDSETAQLQTGSVSTEGYAKRVAPLLGNPKQRNLIKRRTIPTSDDRVPPTRLKCCPTGGTVATSQILRPKTQGCTCGSTIEWELSSPRLFVIPTWPSSAE